MKNNTFSFRYLLQEGILLITIVLAALLLSLFKLSNISNYVILLGGFILVTKSLSIKNNTSNFEQSEVIGLFWRFNHNKGTKISKEEISKLKTKKTGFAPFLVIFLAFGISIGNSGIIGFLLVLLILLWGMPQNFSFLDKNFDNYYKFTGVCTGIVEHKGSNGSSFDVSIVDYENKKELIVWVSYENMININSGQTISVTYSGISKEGLCIA